MADADLKCPHCGKEPTDEINEALDECKIGDGYSVLTHCDHCNGEIDIMISKDAHVQRRAACHSDAELEKLRAAKETGAPSHPSQSR